MGCTVRFSTIAPYAAVDMGFDIFCHVAPVVFGVDGCQGSLDTWMAVGIMEDFDCHGFDGVREYRLGFFGPRSVYLLQCLSARSDCVTVSLLEVRIILSQGSFV